MNTDYAHSFLEIDRALAAWQEVALAKIANFSSLSHKISDLLVNDSRLAGNQSCRVENSATQ